MATIRITVKNADRIADAMRKVPQALRKTFTSAGKEAAAEILTTPGIQQYPPADAANAPPPPYYIRGRGMQYKSRNDHRSERYGSRWTTKSEGYTTVIGNSASYAPYLTDSELQSRLMAARGWKKIADVAQGKIAKITGIYDRWVERMLRELGL